MDIIIYAVFLGLLALGMYTLCGLIAQAWQRATGGNRFWTLQCRRCGAVYFIRPKRAGRILGVTKLDLDFTLAPTPLEDI